MRCRHNTPTRDSPNVIGVTSCMWMRPIRLSMLTPYKGMADAKPRAGVIFPQAACFYGR